jgi:hypothetical protein
LLGFVDHVGVVSLRGGFSIEALSLGLQRLGVSDDIVKPGREGQALGTVLKTVCNSSSSSSSRSLTTLNTVGRSALICTRYVN